MKPENITKIFEEFEKNNPNPKTELEFFNEYQLLVAVILSAQATDISVNKATKELFKFITSAKDMFELGEDGLISYIKSIGLYRAKAKNVISMSKDLIENFAGDVPKEFDSLITLAGVGRKTANVVLNCLFGEETIAVDTHVYRVSRRIGLAKSENIIKLEEELLKNIPKNYLKNAHHWLILHGRYVCKARKPMCNKCKINKYCDYYNEQPEK